MQVTPLTVEHTYALRVAELLEHYRDRFGHLFVAQAPLLGMPVITVGEEFRASEVGVISA